MTALADQIRDALAELGDSPDAIADRLRELDITGSMHGGGDTCPLYVYLHRAFPDVSWVTGSEVLVGKGPIGMSSQVVARLPVAAQEFVHAFDDDVYPDLAVAP